MSAGLDAAALDLAFPCRFTFDASLVLLRCGPGLAALAPDIRPGARFDAQLTPVLPRIAPRFEALAACAGQELVVETHDGLTLSGVVVHDATAHTVELLARAAGRGQADRDRAAHLLLTELAQSKDAGLDAALRRILRVDAEALDIARVSYWSLHDSATPAARIRCEALYLRDEGGRVDSGVELGAVEYPSYFTSLAAGAVVAATDAQHDPRTREFTDSYLAPQGIGAMLDVPVFVGGALVGVLCHEHLGGPRDFDTHEQQIAMAVAQALAQALEADARHRAEEAVRASESRFRQLVEVSPVPILVSRVGDGSLLYVNEGLAHLLRTTRESLLDRRTVDFYYDPNERAAIIAALRRDGHLRERELRIVRPDGSLFWCMLSVEQVKFEGVDALLCGLVDLSEHKQAQAELERVVRVLEERDAILTRDLERARAFQDSMLPHRLSHGDVAIEAAFVPVDQVSGDLYDVDIVGDHLRLFIADATGHGVSAALTTMFLRSEYEVACQAGRRTGDILRALNARMSRFASRLTMRFTAACLLLDLRTGELTWATAAHPPPVIKVDGQVIELDSGGPFVGLVPDAEFPEFRTVLPPGATVCLYTDGVTEALAPDGQPFGERRLFEVLRASPSGLAAAALHAARGFAGQLQDDVTVLTAEWRPRAH